MEISNWIALRTGFVAGLGIWFDRNRGYSAFFKKSKKLFLNSVFSAPSVAKRFLRRR
jgi:hypothetical protein